MDRTRSRCGPDRPYFLFTAVPYALCSVAVFAVPESWGQGAQLVYAFLTFKALGILMSLGAIPYTALMPMITTDQGERLKLGGWRSVGTSVSVVLGTAAVQPILSAYGGEGQPEGYRVAAAIFAVIGLVAILALYRNCRNASSTRPRPVLRSCPKWAGWCATAPGSSPSCSAWFTSYGSAG